VRGARTTNTNEGASREVLTRDGPGRRRSLNRHRCRVSHRRASSADGRQHLLAATETPGATALPGDVEVWALEGVRPAPP
jgi:hypothetical protein